MCVMRLSCLFASALEFNGVYFSLSLCPGLVDFKSHLIYQFQYFVCLMFICSHSIAFQRRHTNSTKKTKMHSMKRRRVNSVHCLAATTVSRFVMYVYHSFTILINNEVHRKSLNLDVHIHINGNHKN